MSLLDEDGVREYTGDVSGVLFLDTWCSRGGFAKRNARFLGGGRM